ncbi:MAG: MBL fold metallo-hydrolase [Dehalococcoidia bacterium]
MQIADGVYSIAVPMPWNAAIPDGGLTHTWVYLLREESGWLMIDAGLNTEEGFQAWQRAVQELGIPFTGIRWLLATHHHRDHLGLAGKVQALTGARLIMHEVDGKALLHFRHLAFRVEAPDQLRAWLRECGMPQEEAAQAQPPWSAAGRDDPPQIDVPIRGEGASVGDSGSLRALWTPGHTPGHLCVHDARRRLFFSGDHILPHITPNVGQHPFSYTSNPLGDYVASLRRVRDLPADLVLPAHESSFANLAGRVDELLEHHRQRLEEVLEAVRVGPASSYQVTSRIHWDVGAWEGLNTTTRIMALFEAQAHIEHLVSEGRLRQHQRDGVALYQLVESAS